MKLNTKFKRNKTRKHATKNVKNQIVILSGSVAEEVYNSFEIGDEYCTD